MFSTSKSAFPPAFDQGWQLPTLFYRRQTGNFFFPTIETMLQYFSTESSDQFCIRQEANSSHLIMFCKREQKEFDIISSCWRQTCAFLKLGSQFSALAPIPLSCWQLNPETHLCLWFLAQWLSYWCWCEQIDGWRTRTRYHWVPPIYTSKTQIRSHFSLSRSSREWRHSIQIPNLGLSTIH